MCIYLNSNMIILELIENIAYNIFFKLLFFKSFLLNRNFFFSS